jgi:hypothetical protein
MWQAFLDLGADLAQNNRFLYGIMVVATMALLGLTLGLVWEGIFSLLKLRPTKGPGREQPRD